MDSPVVSDFLASQGVSHFKKIGFVGVSDFEIFLDLRGVSDLEIDPFGFARYVSFSILVDFQIYLVLSHMQE